MRLIVDGNSLLNAALLRGVDHDGGTVVYDDEGKKVQVNSAQYGIDGFFDKLLESLQKFGLTPRNMIVGWDGKNAKMRRRAFLPKYKEGRDKHPAVSEQLNLARERSTAMLKDMGATVVWQDGMEFDDVVGYLTRKMRSERNVVRTEDGDLSWLVDENTDVYRLGEMNVNPYGPFPHKYITVYKSLVGDTVDKIPGAPGFGDGAFVDFMGLYGIDGLEEMQRMITEDCLHELKENVAELKSLQKVIDGAKTVANSWRCASLHIDAVNVLGRPLQIQAGMVKQRDEVGDNFPSGFEDFYGTKTLVTAANFEKVYAKFARAVLKSPFVALDIETSNGEESDDWLVQVARAMEKKEDKVGIDVLGHELTGMSLTFGDNTQHTIYMSVDHADTDNITVEQCRRMCELIPKGMHAIIQNRAFEFSVLYRTWGEAWKGNGFAGFIPNALDTKIGASYVDENFPKGLKDRSKRHLAYEQQTYEQTTTLSGPVGSLLPGGRQTRLYPKVVKEAVYEPPFYAYLPDEDGVMGHREMQGDLLEPEVTELWEDRQYKMNELPATHVFDYGCDDTICTASLHTFYKLVMDIEQTWQVYLDVETDPEYLTSLAYVQGIPVSLAKVREMERKDEIAYDAAWTVLREYLMTKGWAGTTCPEFEGDIEPSDVKLAAAIVCGEFSTKKRKLNAIAADIREQHPDNLHAELLACAVERNDVNAMNDIVRRSFTGEPEINFGSPAQMQRLFYKVIKMTPRIVNKLTTKQRDEPVLVKAFKKFRDRKAGKSVEFTGEEWEGLISKTSVDDAAVKSALALDTHLGDAERAVLKALQTVKTVRTRRSLFYRTYKALPHWRDGRIHPNINQCEADTRRYSASGPNTQQMPVRGEGAEFREVILPHHKDAVVVSMDFNGQELRLGAELSGDEAMTSCYVGENLRDMHSLTAVAAAPLIWGETVDYGVFMLMLESGDEAERARAEALRGQAKTVNFASQYGAMAAKIAETLMTDEETAEAFCEARALAFPKIGPWSDKVATDMRECGYALTMLGARRHLQATLLSDNHWERSKADRQAGNFWIQGSAAEMTKLAMARMWRSGVFTDGRFDVQFYMPVHDEVVFSVHKGQALEVIKILHPCMVAQYADMKIPIVSSITLGPDFGRQHDCGKVFNEAKIKAALAKCFEPAKELEAA